MEEDDLDTFLEEFNPRTSPQQAESSPSSSVQASSTQKPSMTSSSLPAVKGSADSNPENSPSSSIASSASRSPAITSIKDLVASAAPSKAAIEELRRSKRYPAIIETMKKFRNNAEVQGHCCETLAKAAFDTTAMVPWEGALESILMAMQNFPEHDIIQRSGCFALEWLAQNYKGYQSLIASLGGIPAIIDALRNFPDDKHVQWTACGALFRVVDDHERNKEAVLALDGLELVQAAYRRWPDNWQVKMAMEELSETTCVIQ
eukprot:GILK01013073.1.p1 GENE.GILK01013073.1~~GILK01013073.1.p1  ORF type:complete len:261 (+),score=35.15 GILK01013073.1:186-968(+)